jgi:predicted GNAT superfamily acetyltransferase
MSPVAPTILIKPAVAEDYPVILELNEAAVPAVNSIDISSLIHLHRQSEALLVARELVARDESRVVAFLLALPESADYTSINFQYFQSHYSSFAYVDRIVVDSSYRRSGIGEGLYAELFAATEKPITCEVNVRPPNPGSLAFHQRLGFTVIGEQDTEGGIKRVALMLNNRAAP